MILSNSVMLFKVALSYKELLQVALGKEKPDELGYNSVVAMIAHHKVIELKIQM